MTILGTRPEIIRLSRVIARLDAVTDHVLVHTGQNFDYELNEVFFEEMGVRQPDHFLEAAGKTASDAIGRILVAVDPVLEKERPDAVLILGDTNSSLAAIAAKRRRIPIFHMEAGNRCFDERVPEEINRRIVDHISDINLPYSDIAREYLIREGIAPDRIIKTGSPIFEVLEYYSEKIRSSDILDRLDLKEKEFFVVSSHREENLESKVLFPNFIQALNFLADHYHKKVLVSVHPRTRKAIADFTGNLSRNIILAKPLGYFDYVKLQTMAYAVLSDSGTITEESSILKFPALNLREAHERPEGMEEAVVPMVGMQVERIRQALACLETRMKEPGFGMNPVGDYSVPNVSEKVVRVLISYIDYVNRRVWFK